MTTHLVVGPNQSDNVALGRLLYILRYGSGHTIRELSKKSGVSESYISMIQTGQRTPSLELFCNFLTIFSISYNRKNVDVVEFDEYEVKFTSRIKSARRRVMLEESEIPKVSEPKSISLKKTLRIAAISKALETADDDTLFVMEKILKL